jgi:hypothetical protein
VVEQGYIRLKNNLNGESWQLLTIACIAVKSAIVLGTIMLNAPVGTGTRQGQLLKAMLSSVFYLLKGECYENYNR